MSEREARPRVAIGSPFGWGVAAAVTLSLSWAVALGIRMHQWWLEMYERERAVALARPEMNLQPSLPAPPLSQWLPYVLGGAVTFLVVATVAAALVDVGRPRVALAALATYTVAPALRGYTAFSPLAVGPTEVSPGWPWTETALLLLVLSLPGAVTLLLRRRAVPEPGAAVPAAPVATVVPRGPVSTPAIIALAIGIAVAVRLSPNVGEVLVNGLHQAVADTVVIAVVVAGTTLLVTASRRPLVTTMWLAVAGSAIAVAHSWYETRLDTVTEGALVVAGPILLLLAPHAGRAWRGAFRRGPVVTLRRLHDAAGTG